MEDFTHAHADLLKRINTLSHNLRSARLTGYTIRDIEDLMAVIKVCLFSFVPPPSFIDSIRSKFVHENVEGLVLIRRNLVRKTLLVVEPFYALCIFATSYPYTHTSTPLDTPHAHVDASSADAPCFRTLGTVSCMLACIYLFGPFLCYAARALLACLVSFCFAAFPGRNRTGA